MVTPVIMDVDTGIDDACALLLASLHPGLDVRAVTCVGGNVPLDNVVDNTLRILDLAGAPHVPVAAGVTKPVVGASVNASHFHGADGLGNTVLPPTERTPDPRHAVDLLRDTVEGSIEPLTLIALAPLSNIATFIQLYPETAAKLRQIVWMGGSAGLGNVTASAEFNAWVDPEAVYAVLQSGIELTIYPLEPFYSVALSPDTIAGLQSLTDPIAAALGSMLAHSAHMNAGEARLPGPGFASLGDAGAVCAVLSPENVRSVGIRVAIELTGTHTRGRTVMDLRASLGDIHADATRNDWPYASVITHVDALAFRHLFLSTVCPNFAQ